ncbi:unnamed protein product [Adineta steineri]|uniref:F-box domain-containing protein n=1 Tax=Adineta steineri TaxID=433720 RepID=A0A813XV35_9BILA|nr:unnamed protein product [Adineta steineri]CAF3666256.1 unnamed protein product [Adineta steineri]
MSTDIISYLDNLPVELLYHILKFLDTDTILLSFRYVCKRFYIISNVYNQYELNLNSCTKYNFYRFCRIINPLNIISLILSDDDRTPGQINLFLSFYKLKQFNYLRSLTLLEIEDSNLNIVLKDLSYVSLLSLTIKSRTFFTWTNQTLSCLSTILEQSSLKQFTLSIWCFEIYDFIWPNQCQIEYVHISNRITFEQYCIILERCLYLKTFIIKDVLWNDTNMITSNQYRQLKSLTLEDNRMDIFKLEQFLSLTPSLVYLKVIGMAYLVDSYRWEKILRIKLSNLEKFEFFFQSWKDVNYDFSDIESLIRPFQTSFWLENKRWLVNCDYIINPTEVILYSIPICKSYFQYHDQSNKITCSNITHTHLDETMMNNVTELRLNLVRTFCHGNIEKKTNSFPQPLFHNVTELILDLDDQCSMNASSQTLSNLINLVHLTQLSLNLNYDYSLDLNTRAYLKNIFKQISNIRTLEICNNLSTIYSNITIEDICSLIPSYIEHLKITVKNINDMKIIIDRFEYLSSITFRFSFYKSIPSAKIIESFLNIKKDLTYRKDDCSIRVWLNRFPKSK